MMSSVASAQTDPMLTVVVASDSDGGDLSAAVAAVEVSCRGLRANMVIVHDARETVVIPTDAAVPVSCITVSDALIPILWGHGILAATGSIVALTTSQFRVAESWARELRVAFTNASACAVGGRIAITPDASMLTRAVFFIRYAEHMGRTDIENPHEIAGDNAAYRRDVVLAAAPALAQGFWEVVVHRTMRSNGHTLSRAPLAVSYFVAQPSWTRVLSNRFVHGAHYGEYRVRDLGWSRWRAIAVAPAVPCVLLWRMLVRIRRSEYSLLANLFVVPVILVMLCAWAAGEARGAWRAGQSPRVP